MQELQIKAKCVAGPEERLEAIAAALERDLEEFGPSPGHPKEICIVGSGPSVKKQLKRIKRMQRDGAMILAVKGAHDFLLKNKIIPHAALAVDPQEHIVSCFQKKLPKGEVKRPVYLIASQCHAKLFDFLDDQRVILWHLLATSSHEFLKGKFQVGGGSTSGSRGVVLAWCMGFRKIHLFGFDSCLHGEGPNKLRKITGERWGGETENVMELVCEGKTFYSDPAMAAQANEIQNVLSMLEGAQIKAWGKGLIQTIVSANAGKGWDGYYATSDKFGDHSIPKARPEDAAVAQGLLKSATEGIFRGSDYGDTPQRAVFTSDD